MEEYIKLNKYRKQLEYIDQVIDLLYIEDDGNLFVDFTEDEEEEFSNFIDFITTQKGKIEKRLNKYENKRSEKKGG